MSRPVLALLSDFGLHDHYVGSMKAAALSVCPDATIVDITHEIAPHDILDGALQLAASYRYFPSGTVFVAVVDPGVGSARRGIAAETSDYRFVAPDNGLLSAVFLETPPKRIVELTERRYFRPTVSRTFEGRDRFAPAAAWLAKGIQLSALGRTITNYHLLDIPQVDMTDARLHGVVLLSDRFGNLVTNIDRRTFEAFTRAQTVSLNVAGHPIAGVVATYADIRNGEVCGLFGSTDHLEFAVNGGSAAKALSVDRGAPVEITRA
jgi:S-adenosylmethionine hydrolase